MPVQQDIRDAIAAGNRELAEELYEVVLSKKGGRGIGGQDQQELTALIEAIPVKKAKK